jgi:hypothetical protein
MSSQSLVEAEDGWPGDDQEVGLNLKGGVSENVPVTEADFIEIEFLKTILAQDL